MLGCFSLCSVAGDGEKREVVVGSATREITIRELQPHACYRVHVTAKNDIGKSPVSERSDKFYTLPEGRVIVFSYLRLTVIIFSCLDKDVKLVELFLYHVK